MPRSFEVLFELEKDSQVRLQTVYSTLKETFTSLGYRIKEETSNRIIAEKGSRLATYLGSASWNLVYRRVHAEIVKAKRGKIIVRLIYDLSWLTNIAVLVWAAREELDSIARRLGAKSTRITKFR